jgi:hypothetical protein
MDAITQVTKPRSKDALALSYSWYQTGLSNTIEYCEITWDDFQIKKTDNARLRALAYRFLETGVLTKDPQREKQWLECRIVQRCVDALLKDETTARSLGTFFFAEQLLWWSSLLSDEEVMSSSLVATLKARERSTTSTKQ